MFVFFREQRNLEELWLIKQKISSYTHRCSLSASSAAATARIPPVNSMQSAPAPLLFAFLAQEHVQLFSNTKLTLNSSGELCQTSQWFYFKAVKVAGLALKRLQEVLSSGKQNQPGK